MTATPRVTIPSTTKACRRAHASLVVRSLTRARTRIRSSTGYNGRVLLKNMAALGVVSTALDIFLSHAHWTTGRHRLRARTRQDLTVVLQGFSAHFIDDLRGLCRDVMVVARSRVARPASSVR